MKSYDDKHIFLNSFLLTRFFLNNDEDILLPQPHKMIQHYLCFILISIGGMENSDRWWHFLCHFSIVCCFERFVSTIVSWWDCRHEHEISWIYQDVDQPIIIFLYEPRLRHSCKHSVFKLFFFPSLTSPLNFIWLNFTLNFTSHP